MSDKELIAEARQEESIQDKLGDGFSEGSEERAFYYEHRDRYKRLTDALEVATSERDAALAAVAAIRELLSDEDGQVWSAEGVWGSYRVVDADAVAAALDGAPEAEWEYCFAEIQDDGEIYTNGPEEGFQFATAEAARDASIEESDVVMKRVKGVPAGPWLPVEGEKP